MQGQGKGDSKFSNSPPPPNFFPRQLGECVWILLSQFLEPGGEEREHGFASRFWLSVLLTRSKEPRFKFQDIFTSQKAEYSVCLI